MRWIFAYRLLPLWFLLFLASSHLSTTLSDETPHQEERIVGHSDAQRSGTSTSSEAPVPYVRRPSATAALSTVTPLVLQECSETNERHTSIVEPSGTRTPSMLSTRDMSWRCRENGRECVLSWSAIASGCRSVALGVVIARYRSMDRGAGGRRTRE